MYSIDIMNNILFKSIETIVGPNGLLVGDEVRGRSDGFPPAGGCRAAAIIRPASTGEVSQVMALCHAADQSVVSHGGLTGLVGGARARQDDIALSLERMNVIEPVDKVNRTVLVGAGAPLQKVQEAAEEADLLFPLDLGARGSCTIGGNISTNAGGNSVIRYGMIRDQVLGVEAVLADGTIISSLKGVIKNNTGYDLKQLFIGSEGTLGIVTRAVLRLRSRPRSCNTALVAIDDFDNVCRFLRDIDAALGGTLSAFEVLWNDFYTLIVGNDGRHGQPLESTHDFYVLVESTGGQQAHDGNRFEGALTNALEQDRIADATIAQSKQQRENLWAIRDDIRGLVRKLGTPITFDISLDIPKMNDYVQEVRRQLTAAWPQSRMVTFGHLGDGNIHIVVSVGSLDEDDVHAVESIIYEALGRRDGVISAEHGIGLDKRQYLPLSRSKEEIALMKTLKRAMDPKGILNPGKIFL